MILPLQKYFVFLQCLHADALLMGGIQKSEDLYIGKAFT